MARKNFLEILKNKSLDSDIALLDCLIHRNHFPKTVGYFSRDVTVEELIDPVFQTWKGRNGTFSTRTLRIALGIDSIVNKKTDVSINEAIQYLEYSLNVLMLYYGSFPSGSEEMSNSNYTMAVGNQRQFQDKLNLTPIETEPETYILVPKDPNAIAVAESMNEEPAKLILQYHHYLLKGNLDKKKQILIAMAGEFEKSKPEMPSGKNCEITKSVGYAINNFSIRHSNAVQVPETSSYSDSELEKAYDKIFDLLLTWFQILNYEKTISPYLETTKGSKGQSNG